VALAGRTDAGVHARGQVASFLTGSRLPVETFERGANALLPDDISVRAASEVPPTFDPRRHALSRHYRYTIHLGRRRSALLRQFVWEAPGPLDVDAIAAAACVLVGRHDFGAFTQASEARRRATEREVMRATFHRKDSLALFDIEASAFLPQMVRRIVAALVEVGSGRRSCEGFEALVREAPPGGASAVAPARGLCLMKVRYENGLFDDETDEDI
jgi:tRNA pseudouridine38-40 synthase